MLSTNSHQGYNKVLAATQILKEVKGQTIETATWEKRPDGWTTIVIDTTQGRRLLIEGVAFQATTDLKGLTINEPNCCRYETETDTDTDTLWEIWIRGNTLNEPRPFTIMGEGYDTLTITLL